MMETLETLLQLFNDSEQLSRVYGCMQLAEHPNEQPAPGEVRRLLEASFGNLCFKDKLRQKGSKAVRQARWAIHDRRKFRLFLQTPETTSTGCRILPDGCAAYGPDRHGQ
jgi:Prion-inhibition and propagation